MQSAIISIFNDGTDVELVRRLRVLLRIVAVMELFDGWQTVMTGACCLPATALAHASCTLQVTLVGMTIPEPPVDTSPMIAPDPHDFREPISGRAPRKEWFCQVGTRYTWFILVFSRSRYDHVHLWHRQV